MIQKILITLGTVFLEHALIRCENTCESSRELDLCLEKISDIMPDDRGLPYVKEKVDSYCFSFTSGMKCVDSFTSKCLTPEKRKEFERKMNLKTQRSFMKFLCSDAKFQKTYLSHKKCLMTISDDWYMCLDRVSYLLDYQQQTGRVSYRNQLADVCCTREIFFQCIYKKTYQKCSKKAVSFLKKVTATLLYGDEDVSSCKDYTMERCTASDVARHSVLDYHSSISLVLITTITWLFTLSNCR